MNAKCTGNNFQQKSILYILQADRYFKIGYTTISAEYRLSALQTGNPFKLKVVLEAYFLDGRGGPVASQVESSLHDKYEKFRLYGEWFCLATKDIENIKSLIRKHKCFAKLDTPNRVANMDGVTNDDHWKFRCAEALREVKYLNHAGVMRSHFSARKLKEGRTEIERLKKVNKKIRKENRSLKILNDTLKKKA